MESRNTYNNITDIYPVNSTKKINFMQINAQNSKAVSDEVRKLSCERHIDVIAMQEPYTFQGSSTGMGITTKIITDTKSFSKVRTAGKIKAAIVVFNKNMDILKIEQFCNTHLVCVEIKLEKTRLYMISAYFQHCEPIEPYLRHLSMILNSLQGHPIVTCLDANAKSNTWHSKHTDPKGEALEELISQYQLHILNTDNELPLIISMIKKISTSPS